MIGSVSKCLLSWALIVLALLSLRPAEAWAQGSAERVAVDIRLSRTAAVTGSTIDAAVILDIEDGWHANAHEPTLDYLIGTDVTIEPVPGFSVVSTRYPEPDMLEFGFAQDKPLAVYSGRAVVFVTLSASEEVDPGRHVVGANARIQICNDSVCLAPADLPVRLSLEVVDDPSLSEPANTKLFSGDGRAEAAAGQASEGVETGSPFDGRSAFLAFLAVFGIGLALNLTPCVYPMLSVTVSLFGGRETSRPARSFARAAVYVSGIVVMYAVLGTAAAYTGSLFGAWLQSPWALGFIGVVLLAMALSMLGLFEIHLPSSLLSRAGAAAGSAGPFGLFLSGLLVGTFAAPCIGPPIVALLAYVGSTGDPLFGLATFSVMGVGLGAPYLLLGTFSSLLSRLPKSGAWMVWVKYVFAIVMMGAAAFYLALALVPSYAVYTVPITLVAGGIYLGFLERSGVESSAFRRIKWALGAAAVLAGVLGFTHLQKPAMEWEPYSESVLEQARAERRITFIDFTAEWCIPCLELDQVTFKDERVIEATSDFTRVRVDLTRYDSPESEALRRKFDVAGVPTLLFLGTDGREIEGSRVVGFIGPDELLRRIEAVRGKALSKAHPGDHRNE